MRATREDMVKREIAIDLGRPFRWIAIGTCMREGCGKCTRVKIDVKDEARHMINHEHGHDCRHAFEGEVTVAELKPPPELRKVA